MALVWDMEIRDLPPANDPKGGSPKSGAFKPRGEDKPEKPPSDQIRHISVQDYISAHSHGAVNGERGWKGFFKSNLFAAVVVFLLGQAVVVGGSLLLTYNRTALLIDWKTSVDLTLKRMDEWGTWHGHTADERQDAEISRLQAKSQQLTDLETTLAQLVSSAAERNNQQDKDISELKAQVSQTINLSQDIKTKLAVVADLLDERTKGSKR